MLTYCQRCNKAPINAALKKSVAEGPQPLVDWIQVCFEWLDENGEMQISEDWVELDKGVRPAQYYFFEKHYMPEWHDT